MRIGITGASGRQDTHLIPDNGIGAGAAFYDNLAGLRVFDG